MTESQTRPTDTRQLGRRGASEVKRHQRVLLGVIGLVLAVGGSLLALRPESPELAGTALLVSAVLFVALAVIGRLPRMLEIAGVPLEFDQDEMAEFLLTLRANVDEDTVAVLEDQLRTMSANGGRFDAAQRAADADAATTVASGSTTDGSAQPTQNTEADAPLWLSGLMQRCTGGTVEREARVAGGPGSGRGQPPRVDVLVTAENGERIAVVEMVHAWTDSNLDVLGRRLNRVVENSRTVATFVLVVPAAGMATVSRWRDRMWGNATDRRVEVVAEDSRTAGALAAWLTDLERTAEPL